MDFLSLGIDDFKEIRLSSYYVDKTLIIKEILSTPSGATYLYARPRRFGKSLMLSMLDNFFNAKYESQKLFSNLKIMNEDSYYTNQINKYNVVHLNLKNVGRNDFESFIEKMKDVMSTAYLDLGIDKIDSLANIEKKYVESIINKNINTNELIDSLQKLTRFIYKKNGIKTIILIDEYDSPIQDAFDNGYYDQCTEFFSNYFGQALKSNIYLEKGVISGILKIAQASIFSGLNNLIVDSGLNFHNQEYFGFNEEEVISLFDHYHFHADINKVKEWYGGYHLNREEVFCPWSILSFIKSNGIYDNYWANTGKGLVFAYKNINKQIYNIIEKIVNDEEIIEQLDTNISYRDIDRPKTYLTILALSGYLSIERTIIPSAYLLRIVNQETLHELLKEINADVIKDINTVQLLVNLKKAFLNLDNEGIKYYFENYFLNTLSYYDFNNEKTYQIMLLTLSSLLFDDAVIESEKNVGEGRCDIYISSRNEKNYCYIFELKSLGNKSNNTYIKNSAEKALQQIKKKRYYENAIRYHKNPIILYGISFAGKRIEVKSETLNK